MDGNWILPVVVGILLAAAAGLRVFLPLFVSGLVVRIGLLPIPTSLLADTPWIASDTALILFGAATVVEVVAYKVPLLDHLLDLLGAPAAMGAGVLLATTFLSDLGDPALRYGLGILGGAGAAGAVHLGTAALRVASTKASGGLANPLVALVELIGSLVLTLTSLLLPLIALGGLILGCLAVWFIYRRVARRHSNQGGAGVLSAPADFRSLKN